MLQIAKWISDKEKDNSWFLHKDLTNWNMYYCRKSDTQMVTDLHNFTDLAFDMSTFQGKSETWAEWNLTSRIIWEPLGLCCYWKTLDISPRIIWEPFRLWCYWKTLDISSGHISYNSCHFSSKKHMHRKWLRRLPDLLKKDSTELRRLTQNSQ